MSHRHSPDAFVYWDVWLSAQSPHSTAPLQESERGFSEVGVSLFCQVTGNRTRENSHKSHQGRFRFGIRKNFFTKCVVMHWSRLSRKVVNASSLGVISFTKQNPSFSF